MLRKPRGYKDVHGSTNESLGRVFLLFPPRVELSVHPVHECSKPRLLDKSILGVGASSGFLVDLPIVLDDSLKVLNHFEVPWLGLVGVLLVEAVLD
jgi:hypothetical protein